MVITKTQTKNKKIASKKENESPKPDRYFEATGRRKTSVARVRIFTKGDTDITVNGKKYNQYFFTPDLERASVSALRKMKILERFKISAKIYGGGVSSQAEAMRHAIAKALVKFNADFRKRLKKSGYLTRDSRMKERKKPGLKKARRAPQWSKR